MSRSEMHVSSKAVRRLGYNDLHYLSFGHDSLLVSVEDTPRVWYEWRAVHSWQPRR